MDVVNEAKIKSYRVSLDENGKLVGDVEEAVEIYRETVDDWWKSHSDREKVEIYLQTLIRRRMYLVFCD